MDLNITTFKGILRYYKGVMGQDMSQMAGERYRQFESLSKTITSYAGELKGKKILDIGCGRMYPYTLLLNSLGNSVTGIDTDYVCLDDPLFKMLWKEMTINGLASLLRSIQLRLTQKNKIYYNTLQHHCKFPLNFGRLNILRMSAEDILFPDSTFDIEISMAVFEHIHNLTKAVSEIHRVLKDGGITYNVIHLFSSPSGDHQIDYLSPKVRPWNHLRTITHPPVYLSRLRMNQYISIIKQKFTILDTIFVEEEQAKEKLTPEIKLELKNYSDEELLTKLLIVVAKK